MFSWGKTYSSSAFFLSTSFLVQPSTALAQSSHSSSLSSFLRLDPYSATQLSLLVGPAIFATVTALLHLRARTKWQERERILNLRLSELEGAHDRAELIIGSERQLVFIWNGHDQEPRFEGDPLLINDQLSGRRALAFGSWASPSDSVRLNTAVDRLRAYGEGFSMLVQGLNQQFLEVEGRTMSGQALLRLKDVTGLKRDLETASNHLEKSQAETRALAGLLDVMSQPVWLRDVNGEIVWVNHAYLHAVEAKDLQDIKLRGLELIDHSARQNMERKRLEGERYQERIAAVVAGKRCILDVSEGPSVAGSAGMAIDMSELEAIKTNLQRQMKAHASTLDQLPTAVAIFDSRQRLVFYNAAYRQLWDLDQAFLDTLPLDGEILDQLRVRRKVPEEADFRAWKAGILEAYKAIEPQESWWYLPDRRTLRVVTNPNPQGGLTYLFDDVSERIHLQSQYNALIRVQGETLDTLKEGVAVFGTDGRLKLANPAFKSMWKLSNEWTASNPHVDDVVKRCLVLVPQDDFWNDLRNAVAGLPDARTGLSGRMNRRDGLVLDYAAQPLPDGATLITFVDMTASVNVERALTEKNEALEKASQLRDDFVHHVSYELRSPLTTIIGFAQLLGDESTGSLSARQREYAGHIMRSSGALLAIINDILDLATIDNNAMELHPETVDIQETIQAVVRGVEGRLSELSLTLDVNVPHNIGTFKADSKRVRQVLFNLLSNAVNFSAAGQTVHIHVRRTMTEVVFEIIDHGKGIPQEVIERVFDRFESNTFGVGHRGVGLGLAIVRSFVELHGGHVDLVSKPESGTIATCIFPAGGKPSQVIAAE